MSSRKAVVYRMSIIGTDIFYIGSTTHDLSTYWGSGTLWKRYLKEHNIPLNDNHIHKEILFIGPEDEARRVEARTIRQFFEPYLKDGQTFYRKRREYWDTCLNISCNEFSSTNVICHICGQGANQHAKDCELYDRSKECPECGGAYGAHRKGCTQSPESRCPECGTLKGRHKKNCSRYVFKPNPICPECGSGSRHKSTCSKATKKPKKTCHECGGIDNHHKRHCSKSRQSKVTCSECGGKGGNHRKECSLYIGKEPCPECGSSGSSHFASCSQYKALEPCPECGGKGMKHYKSCSYFKCAPPCPECGGKSNHHRKGCSLYTRSL